MKYVMPAEWDLHEGTWLAWPHNESHWPGKFDKIPPVYAEIVCALVEGGEKVFICVKDGEMERSAREIIGKFIASTGAQNAMAQNAMAKIFAQIEFHHIPTNASWARDHGPIFVREIPEGESTGAGKRVITNWIYNCWGEKYPPWDLDNLVPPQIAKLLGVPMVEPGIVLEGGSIDVNGVGSLLTTEQCLLNKNRNPHLKREEIEAHLRKYLGATNVLWLKEGIIGDDTDGHIDDIARFVDEKTIVCAVEENPADENHKILQKNYEDLLKMHDQNGEPFKIVKMPMPDPIIDEAENIRLPASYINFYIANTAVLLPTFNCARDEEARDIIQKLFPTRRTITIDCSDFVLGLGTIHCSTQQQIAE